MVKMGTVWDRTAEFLSDNIGIVLPVALLAFFVPASIEGNFEAVLATAGPGLTLALRLTQLAFAVLSLWGTLALCAMALDLAGEATAGQIAQRRLLSALLVWVVLGVAALVLLAPGFAILVAGGVDLMALSRGEIPDMGRGTAGAVVLYALLYIVVLMWVGARLVLVTPALVRENRGFGALARSWRLTRGAALRIVGVILLYLAVSWVAQLAANTVFGSIFALVAGDDSQGVSLHGVLTSIVVAAVQTAFLVIVPVFEAKLYLALTAQAGPRDAAAVA
ncbi:glycerophosphoryl diester phosphodiesterase membrane domain-containing protein [Sphingomonas sp. CJ20]